MTPLSSLEGHQVLLSVRDILDLSLKGNFKKVLLCLREERAWQGWGLLLGLPSWSSGELGVKDQRLGKGFWGV